MIREATPDDIEDVIKLGLAFFAEAHTDLTPKFSKEKAVAVIQGMIKSDGCLLYVAERDDKIVGMIGAIISEAWFSSEMTAQEMFWYVLPNYRSGVGIALLTALEGRAKKIGVSLIAMVDLGDKSPVDALLERRGYCVHEKTYVRRL